MKGQSAMEYLMTYGWALLVIVIVIAVLMFIRPFSAPESCVFQQPGFTCEGHRFNAAEGVFIAKMSNKQYKAIKVEGIACVQGSRSPTASDYTSVSDQVAVDGVIPELWTASNPGIHCKDADGNDLTMNAGEDFSGRFYMQYKFTDEPSSIPPKVAYANVIGPVQ